MLARRPAFLATATRARATTTGFLLLGLAGRLGREPLGRGKVELSAGRVDGNDADTEQLSQAKDSFGMTSHQALALLVKLPAVRAQGLA